MIVDYITYRDGYVVTPVTVNNIDRSKKIHIISYTDISHTDVIKPPYKQKILYLDNVVESVTLVGYMRSLDYELDRHTQVWVRRGITKRQTYSGRRRVSNI